MRVTGRGGGPFHEQVTMTIRSILALAAVLGASSVGGVTAQTMGQEGVAVTTPVSDTVRLTLEEARIRALAQNPAFLAEGQARPIAEGRLRQARVYPFNPELEVEGGNAITAGRVGAYDAAVQQEVQWAGQRGLEIDAARHGLARAGHAVDDAARHTLAEVTVAYHAVRAAERRLEVMSEINALNQRLLDAVRSQLREGEVSAMEANLAEIEAGRARARVLTARREAVSARVELNRLIGLEPAAVLVLEGDGASLPATDTLDPSRLLATALEQRPDLAASTAGVDQAASLSRLAGRAAIPNLRIGLLAEREAAGSEPRFGIGVGVGLPVWNRNQGVRDQRRAEVRQAELSRSAVVLRVRAEVADAYRSYVFATEEEAAFSEQVRGPARENQSMLETAYQAGKLGLPELLLLRNQLLDAELGYWDAWLARRAAFTRLQAATGAIGGAP